MLGLRQYLKECSEHAQKSRIIVYAAMGIAALSVIQNILPLVDIDTSPYSRVPRLPVPWALTIFMAGFATVVLFGGYHRALADQAKHDDDVRNLKEQLTDVPSLHVMNDGPYNDMRQLQKLVGAPPEIPVQVDLANLSCLHVRFKNDPKRSTPNSVAKNILADVTFYDATSESLICNIRGRWGDKTQPPLLQPHQTAADTLTTANFEIGQERELDIAFKYPSEPECYAMSNETYEAADWKYPKQRISSSEIMVHIRLRGVAVDASWTFWFENPKAGELKPKGWTVGEIWKPKT